MCYLFCLRLSLHDNNRDYNNETNVDFETFLNKSRIFTPAFHDIIHCFFSAFHRFFTLPRYVNRAVTNDHRSVFHLFERLEPSLGCSLFCLSISIRLWYLFRTKLPVKLCVLLGCHLFLHPVNKYCFQTPVSGTRNCFTTSSAAFIQRLLNKWIFPIMMLTR